MGQSGTGKALHGQALQATDLQHLLRAECIRARRRHGPGRLVVLRLVSSPQETVPDVAAKLAGLAQECDSVVALDKETWGLFLPSASQSLASSCLKKALGQFPAHTVQGHLLTLPDAAFGALDASDIEKRIWAELARDSTSNDSTSKAARQVVPTDILCDQSRVSAEERSFLLAPL